jgi:hypothetical protein
VIIDPEIARGTSRVTIPGQCDPLMAPAAHF